MATFSNPLAARCYRQSTKTVTLTWNDPTLASDTRVNRLEIDAGGPISGWRRKIASGQMATTSLTVDAYELSSREQEVLVERHRYFNKKWELYQKSRLYGSIDCRNITSLGGATLSVGMARSLALEKFNSRVRSAQTSLEGGVALGELGQTLRMIRNPLKGVYDLMRRYTRGAKKAASIGGRRIDSAATRRAVANLYLEGTFGWGPLINDTIDAAKAASRIVIYRMPTQYVKGEGQDRGNLGRITESTSAVNFTLKRTYHTFDEANCRIYGAVKLRSGWSGGMRDIGIYPRNFLPTIYNLLPWSFVYDYFTSMGSIIESASICRSDLAWVNEGIMTRRVQKCVSLEVIVPGGGSTSRYELIGSPTPSWELSRVHKSRGQFTGSFVPRLAFRIPGLSLKWLNLAALRAQR